MKSYRRKLIQFTAALSLIAPLFLDTAGILLNGQGNASMLADTSVIVPNYATGEERAHPNNSWAQAGQDDVINHTGNTSDGLDDFVTSPGIASEKSDFINNYITYSNRAYAIRQFAQETSTPGLYDVYTNIRGNQTVDVRPMSIVLVSDHSSSMADNNKMALLDAAIENFADTLSNYVRTNRIDPDRIRIGHTAYGNGVYTTGARYVPLGNYSTDQTNLLKNATPAAPEANQGTFTQAGLRQADAMLEAEDADRKKIVILLTDGVPTLANRITGATDNNGNNTIDVNEVTSTTTESQAYLQGYTTAGQTANNFGNSATTAPADLIGRPIDGAGTQPGITPRHVQGTTSGPTYNSVFPATTFSAKNLENKGIEVHGIGIAINAGTAGGNVSSGGNTASYPGFSLAEIENYMRELTYNASYYQNVYAASDLTTYLNQTLLQLFDTVRNGTARIKIGEHFTYTGASTLSVDYFVNGQASNLQTYEATYDNGVIRLNNLDLGLGQEVQIHHQVHLQTERTDFSPDTWRFISDPVATYFIPNPAISTTELPFAVPAGRAAGTTIDLTKIWEDMSAENASRPEHIELEIQRSTPVDESSWQTANYLLTGRVEDNKWTATKLDSLTLEGGEAKVALPLFNNNGEYFTYKIVRENGADAYSSSISQDGKTVTNTERWKFEVIKQSNEGISPAGAVFELKTADGTIVNTGISRADGLVLWEDAAFRFSKDTTYHLIETTALPAHNVAGPWTIAVSADNTISMNADNENDEESVYIATKDEQSATFKVTLVNHRDVTRLQGVKTWRGDEGKEQFRPATITVQLFQNDELLRQVEVAAPKREGDEEISDTWSYDFGLVPVKDLEGNAYVYTVKELNVPHYLSVISGLNIINTLDLSNIDLDITKIWEDNGNRAGHRPERISFQLYRDNIAYGEPVELAGERYANQWDYTFENLQEYKNATEKYDYEIRELNVSERYTDKVVKIDEQTFDIINTFVPELTKISGQKIWDERTPEQFMPGEITIELWAYPTDEVSETAPTLVDTKVVAASDDWKYEFVDLAKEDEEGRAISYQVREVSLANFSPQYPDNNVELGQFDIKNIFTPNLRDISVTKSWNDYDIALALRPESVTVELLRDDEIFLTTTVTASNDWTYTFENLPVYRSSALDEYVYTTREVNVPLGYQEGDESADDFNLTNTLVENKAVTGDKTWVGDEATNIRPENITVQLWRYGYNALGEIDLSTAEPVLDQAGQQLSAEVSASTDWAFNFDNLPKYDFDELTDRPVREISYFVSELLEESVASSYETTIAPVSDSLFGNGIANHFAITNTLTGLPIFLEVNKQDADFGNAALPGVNFVLTSTETQPLMPFALSFASPLLNPLADSGTTYLRSDANGQLRRLAPNTLTGAIVTGDAGLVELDYESNYQLLKLGAVGLFPSFDQISQWSIHTPTVSDAINHIADNDWQIAADSLVSTPDHLILATDEQEDVVAAPAMGRRALIRTSKINLAQLNPYVLSFDIASNVTHGFSIEKVDADTNQKMDTQFRLRWVERWDDGGNFATMSQLDLTSLNLRGTGEQASEYNVDATTGAPLSTIEGEKTINNMSRGNLYIISEPTPPAGYQKSDTMIVAYMDQAAALSADGRVQIRLARRSVDHPNVLVFDDVNNFPEYRGWTPDGRGIRFANFKIGQSPVPESEKRLSGGALPPDSSGAKIGRLPRLNSTLEVVLALLGFVLLITLPSKGYWRKKLK
ncbi:Cna B-type domain-containing protein [Lactococcus taiwanensis]|uniref:Cna B-type domain-containing protein n=1 Tax=Lactococcus taiwanensis TaxID=1151742 RepID=UPI00196554AE|nr:Cna B-type domain-containing protein [Lactococcus taiwanensis]QRZ10883.1 Cna B-type domain-containing protein [Lactococcus taiwanensis]